MYQALQDHFKGIVMVSSTKIYIGVKAQRHVEVDKRENLWNFSFKLIFFFQKEKKSTFKWIQIALWNYNGLHSL